ncbi:hypothetical protein BH11ACT7_BH11ACT7_24910 [soil metagenome]
MLLASGWASVFRWCPLAPSPSRGQRTCGSAAEPALFVTSRAGADHLGHSRISMTQDKYMARGRMHTAVADLLDRTINDE